MRLSYLLWVYSLARPMAVAAQDDYIGGLLQLLQSSGYTTMTKWMNLVLGGSSPSSQAYNSLLNTKTPQTLFVPTNDACTGSLSFDFLRQR